MSEQKMTIHRALSDLKLIDARIQRAIDELEPVFGNQKGKKVMGYLTEDEFKSTAQAGWDSVIDLITRKSLIKSAIVKSNAQTIVTVGGNQYTVADAITFKKIVDVKTKLSLHLKGRFKAITGELNKANEKVDANVNILLGNALGAEAAKATPETIENIAKPYRDMNIVYLIDPLDINAKISALDKDIQDFSADIDAVLSESNAVTFITI